jgi:hypothetical protein
LHPVVAKVAAVQASRAKKRHENRICISALMIQRGVAGRGSLGEQVCPSAQLGRVKIPTIPVVSVSKKAALETLGRFGTQE